MTDSHDSTISCESQSSIICVKSQHSPRRRKNEEKSFKIRALGEEVAQMIAEGIGVAALKDNALKEAQKNNESSGSLQ